MMRRTFLNLAGGSVLLPLIRCSKGSLSGNDISQMEETVLEDIEVPFVETDAQSILSDTRAPICFRGAGYSQGGHTLAHHGVQIDVSGLNKLVFLDVARKIVRVQAGMKWIELQALLDPHELSVKVMQSFSNFSVGGAVSVNCHGRYVGQSSISSTVRAMRLILPSGEALEVSRQSSPELFAAVLGGYGLLGLITEVELDLAHNVAMERHVQEVALEDYPAWFRGEVLANPDSIFHNADLLPPSFDQPVSISWTKSNEALTDTRRLQTHQRRYSKEQNLVWLATEIPGSHSFRKNLTSKELSEPRVIWRNLEASLDVRRLEPRTRLMSTYLLQEYFIPVDHFVPFARAMSNILASANVEVMNVSIRHALPDDLSILKWAKHEVFCFVIYYKQRRYTGIEDTVKQWTRSLIDEALKWGGTYYLPYRPLATQRQVREGYPDMKRFLSIKQDIDPQGRLRNHFWDRYLSS